MYSPKKYLRPSTTPLAKPKRHRATTEGRRPVGYQEGSFNCSAGTSPKAFKKPWEIRTNEASTIKARMPTKIAMPKSPNTLGPRNSLNLLNCSSLAFGLMDLTMYRIGEGAE